MIGLVPCLSLSKHKSSATILVPSIQQFGLFKTKSSIRMPDSRGFHCPHEKVLLGSLQDALCILHGHAFDSAVESVALRACAKGLAWRLALDMGKGRPSSTKLFSCRFSGVFQNWERWKFLFLNSLCIGSKRAPSTTKSFLALTLFNLCA